MSFSLDEYRAHKLQHHIACGHSIMLAEVMADEDVDAYEQSTTAEEAFTSLVDSEDEAVTGYIWMRG